MSGPRSEDIAIGMRKAPSSANRAKRDLSIEGIEKKDREEGRQALGSPPTIDRMMNEGVLGGLNKLGYNRTRQLLLGVGLITLFLFRTARGWVYYSGDKR